MRLEKQKLIAAFFACGLAPLASVHAGTIAQAETNASGTTGVTIDQGPVITAIGSLPGTGDGYTYTNYALITQDATASLEIFGKLNASNSNYVTSGTTPAVGDLISATGTYSPFNSIPELGTQATNSVTLQEQGDPAPAAIKVSAATLANAANDTNSTYLGYYLELTNVVFTPGTQATGNVVPGNFPTHANGTYSVTDVGGTTPLILFQYASSYSAAGSLGGTQVPTVPCNIYGIVDVFTTTGQPEFIPFSIVDLPEPTSMTLLGVGALGLLKRRRKAM